MAWTNVFDLGACDVYVRFNSASGSGVGETVLVPIADLDASIGAVSVVDGVVQCVFEGFGSGEGGAQPEVVVVPQYDASVAVGTRAREADLDTDLPAPLTYTAGIGSLTDEGGGEYSFASVVDAAMEGDKDNAFTATLSQGVPVDDGINVLLIANSF